jgi:multicomponent Na+:H+ antiporter subunit D
VSHAIVAAILVPFAGGVAAVFLRGRAQSAAGLASGLLTLGAVAWLAATIADTGAAPYPLGGWDAPLGIVLAADGLSVLMLALTAIVGLVVSVYAVAYFGHLETHRGGAALFWPLWLLLWGGLNALFVARDIFTLYLLLEFTLLAAVALAALGGSRAAHVSALRYLLSATTAALFYLMGVTLLYAEAGTLDLEGLRAASPQGVPVAIALALMLGALALKCALFPLHFWLPAAHSTAPAPVSAVLSALVVKAGFYVIVRVWVQALPAPLPGAAHALALAGAAAILWGSWRAMRQERLKMLVAYSTVAQVGYLFLLLPLAGVARAEVVGAATYQMLSHGLSKAAMFLGAGAVIEAARSDLLTHTRGTARRAPLGVAAIVFGGAALAGVLPGAGAKGKMLHLAVDHGQWWWAAVIAGGMLLAGAYTVAAVRPAFGAPGEHARGGPAASRLMGGAALALALAALALSFGSDAALSWLEVGAP